MKIVCFGDSLTFGSIGYSYIKYLDPKYKIINKGINGDTTICTYERLKRFIDNPKHNDVDVYVIAIGTNDLLLPYLTHVSLTWRLQMALRVKMKKCISDDTLFETEYQKFIQLISSHNKKVITVGLPLLQLEKYPNERVQKRNLIVKRLADDHHAIFIDAALLQQQAIQNISTSYSWKHKNMIRMIDGMIMLALPFTKDWFSKLRRLELTVDGVHFNSLAAKLIGTAIQEKIS